MLARLVKSAALAFCVGAVSYAAPALAADSGGATGSIDALKYNTASADYANTWTLMVHVAGNNYYMGGAACSDFDEPTRAAVYLGDSWGDFPADGEEEGARLDGVGSRYFVLPNPLYGEWQFLRGITRPLP